MSRPALLLALFALVAFAALTVSAQQALPAGAYVQNPASEFVALTLPSPEGYPLYLYELTLTVAAGGYSASGLAVILESQEKPLYNNVTFSGQFSCDRQSRGLLFTVLTCADQGQLCESGWFYDSAGNGPYPFGPGVDAATNKTTLALGRFRHPHDLHQLRLRSAHHVALLTIT